MADDNEGRRDGDRVTPSPGYHAAVKPPSTLDELGAFLVDMRATSSQGFANVLREQSKTNDRLASLEDVVAEHNDLIDDIAAEVFSVPPPPNADGTRSIAIRLAPARVAARLVGRRDSKPRSPSIASRTEGVEEKLAELAGQVIAARSDAKKAEEKAEDARKAAAAAHETAKSGVEINKQQSRAMGLSKPEESTGRKFLNLVLSREGAKLFGGLATALLALAAAISSQRASHDAGRAADRPAVVVTSSPPSPPSPRP